MTHLSLSDKVDFHAMFEAEAARLGQGKMEARGWTKEKFIAASKAMTPPSIGFNADGRPIGGIFLLGDEAHLAVLPEFHGKWHALWKPAMKWLFSIRETVYGYTEADNHQCIRFLQKNGWTCTGNVEKYGLACIGFRMTAGEIREMYGFSQQDLSPEGS